MIEKLNCPDVTDQDYPEGAERWPNLITAPVIEQRLVYAPNSSLSPKPKATQTRTPAFEKQVGGDHYKTKSIQPIEYILANGLGFCEGNIVKYITRYADKGGVDDVKKVIHYAEMLIEHLETQKEK